MRETLSQKVSRERERETSKKREKRAHEDIYQDQKPCVLIPRRRIQWYICIQLQIQNNRHPQSPWMQTSGFAPHPVFYFWHFSLLGSLLIHPWILFILLCAYLKMWTGDFSFLILLQFLEMGAFDFLLKRGKCAQDYIFFVWFVMREQIRRLNWISNLIYFFLLFLELEFTYFI